MRLIRLLMVACLITGLQLPLQGQVTDPRLAMLTCALLAAQGEGLDATPLDTERFRFAAARFLYASPDAARIDAMLVEVVQDSASAPYRLHFTEGMIRREGWSGVVPYHLLPGSSPQTRRAIAIGRERCDSHS
jgi:hypothetical protein